MATMEIIGHLSLAALASASLTLSAHIYAAETEKIKILLAGDSTVTDHAGWGGAIGEFFADHVEIANHAVGGRSSKSFIDEGRLEEALAENPDYMFIQFGHNDCPGKGPERETDPASSYMGYLTLYVAAAREIGARPILVTPMTRRRFDDTGKIKSILTPYADAVKRVGRELNVPVIDLHVRSVELFERLGDAGGSDLQPEGDRTHFNAQGARVMAGIIAELLPEADAELAKSLRENVPPPGPCK